MESSQVQELQQQLVSDLVKIGTIPEQTEVMGAPFPLVLVPADNEHVNYIQLQEYLKKNHEKVLKAASVFGTVMFKGFEIKSGQEWASVMYQSGIKEMNYVGGAAVRNLIVGTEGVLKEVQVLTTNESPPSEPIPFHHELAQTSNPPDHICFFCQQNSAKGGSTPLIRSDFVYDYLQSKYPDFCQEIEAKKVKYIKITPEEDDASSALGRSWKSMFHVKTKEDAEAEMTKLRYTWEWLDNGECKVITEALPAVRVSSNGKKTFFNQIIAAYTGWIDKRNDPKKAVVYGDGTPLPSEILDDLSAFMIENRCAYQWTNGQFAIVDNTVTYHSRQPFSGGRRKVFACIGKGTKPVEQGMTAQTLTNGQRFPSIGLGLWKLGKDTCSDIVYEAIKAGYRHLDSACDYGNEKEVGNGIKRALDDGLCKREDLFITSKLWNTYHRKEHVEAACKKTLSDLQLDYLDLYLIHFPISLKFVPFEQNYPPEWKFNEEQGMVEDPVSYIETWRAMEDLVGSKLVKSIGSCNIGTTLLREVCAVAKIKPAVLQVEMHPYNTQQKLIRYCREAGIQITAFSPLGSSSYLELGLEQKPEEMLINQPLIAEIGKKHNKSAGQVLIRWAVQRGTSVIPKTSKIERLSENINVFDFNISTEDMNKISALNKNQRFNDPGDFAEPAFGLFYPIYE